MKLVGIGDLFIPKEYIQKGFQSFEALGVEVKTLDWQLKDFQELQNINLLVEQGGSEAYEVPQYILDAVVDADILITQFCPANKKVFDNCKNLKVVGVLRGGYENVNVEEATIRNVLVYNTPGRNSDSVADFTIGAIISECRNIARGHLGLKTGKWIREYPNSDYIPDLPGKTVGLIGFGEIGRKVAKRFQGFDVKVLVFDPYAKTSEYDAELVDLDTLLKESDFVSIHARLTEENRHMINEEKLQLMKPTAYLVNTSRAGLIDEKALYMALKSKTIAGAMLDVFEVEPPGIDYPLVTLDNVTITPHMAGGSKDAFFNSPIRQAEEMIKLWKGEKSRYIINPGVFDINDDIFMSYSQRERKDC